MNNVQEKSEYMLKTPLSRLIPSMALPTIAAMLMTTIYNLTDTFFVSKLGTNAAAAVGVNASIDQIIMMAGSFFAIGAASYVSRRLGAKQKEAAERVFSACFWAAMFFGLLVLVFGSIFMEELVLLLGATENTLLYSKQYATYILIAAPFMASTFVLNQCLRAEGAAARAMLGTVAGAVINIVLDPIFIFGLELGVAGASMATAISKLVSFILLTLPYLRGKTLLKVSLRNIRVTTGDIVDVASMGSSSLLRNVLALVAAILLNNLAGNYSDAALAAISVVNRIGMLFMSLCLGFGQGFQPVAGFCWGAGHYKRVKEAFYYAVKIVLIVLIVVCGLIFLLAEPIIGIFTENDAEMLALGVFSLRAHCVATPLHGVAVVVNMLHVGIGKGRGAVILSTSRQGSCFLPILPVMVMAFGVYGVAAVQPAADILAGILSLFFAGGAMKELGRLAAQTPEM